MVSFHFRGKDTLKDCETKRNTKMYLSYYTFYAFTSPLWAKKEYD
eukprot:UN14968